MMSLSKRSAAYLTILLWIAAALFLIAILVAYVRLDRRVTRLRQQEIVLRRNIDQAVSERDSLASDMILLKNASIGYDDFVQKMRPVLDGNCGRAFVIRCRRYLAYGDLLAFQQYTLLDRVSAKDRARYADLLERYRQTHARIDRVPWLAAGEGQVWHAAMWEGEAYSLWRLGRPREAIDPIRRAYAEVKAATVVLTYLKVGCALRWPAAQIRAAYDGYTRRLAERTQEKAATGSPVERRNADFNLQLFQADRELLSQCSYAGLRPAPPR